jgi:hypothetical protein
MGRSHGIYYCPGNAVLGMAVRDEAPLGAPYPKDFFAEPREEEPGDAPGDVVTEVPPVAGVPRV